MTVSEESLKSFVLEEEAFLGLFQIYLGIALVGAFFKRIYIKGRGMVEKGYALRRVDNF